MVQDVTLIKSVYFGFVPTNNLLYEIFKTPAEHRRRYALIHF